MRGLEPRCHQTCQGLMVRPNKAKDEVTNTAPSWKNVTLEVETERRKFRGKNSLLEHHSPGRVSRTDKWPLMKGCGVSTILVNKLL